MRRRPVGQEARAGGAGGPELTLLNRQRGERVDLRWLKRFSADALQRCLGHSADGGDSLRGFEEIVVTLVSDRRIAQIHGDFMGIPTATDVITFQHGEIVVSAETARRSAVEFGHGFLEELGLYVVHGFLHLNGYTDGEREERERMHQVQDLIWRETLRGVGSLGPPAA
jgi:probable rRNA maturation factor